MKIDLDKKHPLTSVDLIPENQEDEYLTEEQTSLFKAQVLKAVRLCVACCIFSLSTVCLELPELFCDLSKEIKTLFYVIGSVGALVFFSLLILLIISGKKLKRMSDEFANSDKNGE